MKWMWKQCLQHKTTIVTGDFNACARTPPASRRQHPDDDYVTQALKAALTDLGMRASVAWRKFCHPDGVVHIYVLGYGSAEEVSDWAKWEEQFLFRLNKSKETLMNYSLRLPPSDTDWHRPLFSHFNQHSVKEESKRVRTAAAHATRRAA